MMYYEAIDIWNSPDSYLEHHGVKGMKWGVRRYLNENGSLTPKGRKRYYQTDNRGRAILNKKGQKFNDKNV